MAVGLVTTGPSWMSFFMWCLPSPSSLVGTEPARLALADVIDGSRR